MAPRFHFQEVIDTLFPEGRAKGMQIFTEDEMAQINGIPDKAKARARRKKHAQKQNNLASKQQALAVATVAGNPNPIPAISTPPNGLTTSPAAQVASTSLPSQVAQLLAQETAIAKTSDTHAPFMRLWQTLQQHSFPPSNTTASVSPSQRDDRIEKSRQPMVWSLPDNIQRLEAQLVNAPEFGPQPMFDAEITPVLQVQSQGALLPEEDLFAIQEIARQEISHITQQEPAPSSMPLVTSHAVDSLLASARLDTIVQDQTHRLLERNRFLSQSINNLAENYFQMQRSCG